jgi:peptidoglycan hydrolase CwlO-like protein
MINTQPSPYQVGFAQAPTSSMEDLKRQFEIQKDEEKRTHKAQPNLPNTLQTVVNQFGDIYLKFVDIRNALELAKQNTRRTEGIEILQQKIDRINEQIFDLTNDLDKIKM